ncbi:flagellar biosynthesis protein FlgA [Streptomyces sp. NA02950]|uniref:SAF domain-containing protein n=1 Tax=Streptomyces sp. NA02950 TaxID=2742137 RepID=UPI0015900BCC|nr:SAF domain-containing protein [Streptomyces sp. NA02950]QKV90403.1 flagellar biosynthesis protein FlgA [Streptomyces sp. NA02950]QKV97264.1 flagellar biosynthesis protein FlgA [Streptomyces sp. NA02950]
MSKTKDRSAPGAGVPAPVAGPVTPPRVSARRRRPGLIALAVVLITGGGAGGAVLLMESGHRTEVVTVVRAVPVGQVITDRDLGEASVALDPAVKVADRSDVVGKRAAVELKPGSLLSSGQVTSGSLVRPGEQVVPVGLKPEQVPASSLAPGQKVQIVQVPGEDEEASKAQAEPISARVVRVGDPTPGTGSVVVDVAADRTETPLLAAWVSTGKIRLLIDAQGGA